MSIFIKNSSLSKKVHIPLILSMLIGLAIITVTAFLNIDEIKVDVYDKESESIENYMNGALEQKYAVGITNAIMLSKDSVLKSISSVQLIKIIIAEMTINQT